MEEISEASSALIITEPEPASETSQAFKCFNFLFNRRREESKNIGYFSDKTLMKTFTQISFHAQS